VTIGSIASTSRLELWAASGSPKLGIWGSSAAPADAVPDEGAHDRTVASTCD